MAVTFLDTITKNLRLQPKGRQVYFGPWLLSMATCLHVFRLDPYEAEHHGGQNMWQTHTAEGRQELVRRNIGRSQDKQ